jgi:hypothetical protein
LATFTSDLQEREFSGSLSAEHATLQMIRELADWIRQDIVRMHCS